MLVIEEAGKSDYPEKTSLSRVENQQTQSTYDGESGNRTRATLMGGECSHYCVIPCTPWLTDFIPLPLLGQDENPPANLYSPRRTPHTTRGTTGWLYREICSECILLHCAWVIAIKSVSCISTTIHFFDKCFCIKLIMGYWQSSCLFLYLAFHWQYKIWSWQSTITSNSRWFCVVPKFSRWV